MTRKRIAIVLGGALGVMMAALVLTGVLHDGGTAKAQAPPQTFWKVSMPDLGQHSTGWCWVGAAANSFWWYADNVSGQEGLLGGALKPWKNIDIASTTPPPNPVSVCGTVIAGRTWFDSRDGPPPGGDGAAIAGYPTVLLKIAEKTFYDLDQDGTKDGNEDNYCFSEGVEKWDYLVGLRDYVASYGSRLKVHDIIEPAKCGVGTGFLPVRPPTMPPTMNQRDPCLPLTGVDQVVRPVTFTDYMTELSDGQDVLLWMEGQQSSIETAHVVTGVGYDNTPGIGLFGKGTLTISDPWTHTTNAAVPPNPVPSVSHTDDGGAFFPPPWQPKPDHNTSGAHAVYPASTDPYNRCDIVSAANPLQIQCYNEDTGAALVWNVVDLIFVSPVAMIGGIAELPDVAQAPGRQSDSSTGGYAALAGVLAAAFVTIAAGAWYARRRFSRS